MSNVELNALGNAGLLNVFGVYRLLVLQTG
jgi:hypothetical protein